MIIAESVTWHYWYHGQCIVMYSMIPISSLMMSTVGRYTVLLTVGSISFNNNSLFLVLGRSSKSRLSGLTVIDAFFSPVRHQRLGKRFCGGLWDRLSVRGQIY